METPHGRTNPDATPSFDAIEPSGDVPGAAVALTTLPRILGPFDALTVVVGSIIGSGIFLTKTGIVAHQLGSYGFAVMIGVWIVIGLVTLCGALALAELAAMLPQAGGPYVYLREAYGRLPAFLWGWTEFWVIRTGSIGALAAATTIYINEVRPGWMPHLGQMSMTIAIVVGLSIVNMVGTHWAAHLQNLTSVLKVGFLAALIVLPFVMGVANSANLTPVLPTHVDMNIFAALGAAMIAVLWPYDGWINIGPVAEEIRDPQRNVPLALTAGMILVIVVYVLANVSYHLVIPLEELAVTKAVAAKLFERVLGAEWAVAVSIGVACSTFGATNSNMITGPRIYFAMARDGLLPRAISRVNARFHTPVNAILIQCVWTVILVVVAYAWKDDPGDAFDALTNYVIFGGLIFYSMAVGAVFVLRRKLPDLPRPYKTLGYPVTPALYLMMFGLVMVSLLYETPWESAAGFILIAAGCLFYKWAKTAMAER